MKFKNMRNHFGFVVRYGIHLGGMRRNLSAILAVSYMDAQKLTCVYIYAQNAVCVSHFVETCHVHAQSFFRAGFITKNMNYTCAVAYACMKTCAEDEFLVMIVGCM